MASLSYKWAKEWHSCLLFSGYSGKKGQYGAVMVENSLKYRIGAGALRAFVLVTALLVVAPVFGPVFGPAFAQDIVGKKEREPGSERKSPPALQANGANRSCAPIDAMSSRRILSETKILLMFEDRQPLILLMDGRCPDLKFHDYFSYSAVNGALCAGRDSITTRAGLSCQIAAVIPATKKDMAYPAEPRARASNARK